MSPINANKKNRFLQNSKINSIELTFEYSDDIDIIEWLERIKENKIPYEWFYYNEKEKVISHYEQELIKENNERRTKRTKSAEVAIRKLLKEKLYFYQVSNMSSPIQNPMNISQKSYHYIIRKIVLLIK